MGPGKDIGRKRGFLPKNSLGSFLARGEPLGPSGTHFWERGFPPSGEPSGGKILV